jgi:hypothetical protein
MAGDDVRGAETGEDAVLVLQWRAERELGGLDCEETARVEVRGERDCGSRATTECA